MILPTPEMLLAIAAVLFSIWSAVAVKAIRTSTARTTAEIDGALGQCRLECRETTAKLLLDFNAATPETAFAEPRASGPLHRSRRAHALKLLRSGVPAASAAATLDLPQKEVVLLARVASILAQ